MPWLSSAEYDRLVEQLESAQAALTEERASNRRMERHLINMWLRSKAGGNSFPLQPEGTEAPQPATVEHVKPTVDEGELAALIEEGARMGVGEADVVAMVYKDRGISLME